MLTLIVGLNILHELDVSQRQQTDFLLFTDLTTRKQVEAFPHGALQQRCNADCTSERASFTLLLHYSPELVEKFCGLGEVSGPQRERLAPSERRRRRERRPCEVGPFRSFNHLAVKVNHPRHSGPRLGRHDPPSGHWVHFSPQRHIRTDYSPKPREARAGVENY